VVPRVASKYRPGLDFNANERYFEKIEAALDRVAADHGAEAAEATLNRAITVEKLATGKAILRYIEKRFPHVAPQQINGPLVSVNVQAMLAEMNAETEAENRRLIYGEDIPRSSAEVMAAVERLRGEIRNGSIGPELAKTMASNLAAEMNRAILYEKKLAAQREAERPALQLV
jgi:hypothetical protein